MLPPNKKNNSHVFPKLQFVNKVQRTMDCSGRYDHDIRWISHQRPIQTDTNAPI